MPSLGHGISDAVRKHIPLWVDEQLVDLLYEEHKKAGGRMNKEGRLGFRAHVKTASDWVRKSRKTTSTGYERLYHCKTVPNATLVVHSPSTDKSANAYVFHMDGKPIAGGKTKLQSTHVSQAVSSKDKTSIRPADVQFVKFSEEELRIMRTKMEFSDGLESLEYEREA